MMRSYVTQLPRVVMFAPRFYPCHTVSAHRASKFSKYLPEFGYASTVITVDPVAAGWPTDERLGAQIPSTTRVRHAFYPFSRQFKTALRGGLEVHKAKQATASKNAESASSAHSLLDRWLGVPDKDIYWMPWAVTAGLRRARDCDVIYATAPPSSILVIGAMLKLLMRRPLVLDLRDPWTINDTSKDVHTWPTPLHGWLDVRLERWVFARADAIICNTEPVRQRYIELYPALPRDRFVVINNGYDTTDVHELPCAQRNDGKVRIGYFGMIYAGRDPIPLFRAARDAVKRGLIAAGDVEFVFFGPNRPLVESMARDEQVSAMVDAHDRVPYGEALRQMAACDALMLLSSPQTDALHIPAKTFEYMAFRKPVFAIAGPGAIASLMERHAFGLRAGPNEHERLVDLLVGLVKDHQAGRIDRYLPDHPEQFTRRAQTEQFAALLDRLRRRSARR